MGPGSVVRWCVCKIRGFNPCGFESIIGKWNPCPLITHATLPEWRASLNCPALMPSMIQRATRCWPCFEVMQDTGQAMIHHSKKTLCRGAQRRNITHQKRVRPTTCSRSPVYNHRIPGNLEYLVKTRPGLGDARPSILTPLFCTLPNNMLQMARNRQKSLTTPGSHTFRQSGLKACRTPSS